MSEWRDFCPNCNGVKSVVLMNTFGIKTEGQNPLREIGWFACCEKCGAMGKPCKTKDDAVREWNEFRNKR